MEEERAAQQKLMEERISAGGADMEKEREAFEKRMQD